MTPFLQLIFALAVIVLSAKIGGYISVRFGQPSVLGELLVGLILGPSLIDLTHLPFITNTHLEETLVELGELGVLLLMFVAGLELHLSELVKNTRVAAFAGILGVFIPVGLGLGTGFLFGMHFEMALFLGLVLGATSVSISAQTLIELGVIRSRVGLGLLGSAVFDDVLVILLLSTFLALISGSTGIGAVALILLRMIVFLSVGAAFGFWLLPGLVDRVKKLPISQNVLSLALVTLLVYGLAAELIGGMAAITGTFLAGLMFARSAEKPALENGIRAVAYSLFVPIFFVSIGLEINLREMNLNALWLLLVVTFVAIIGKLLGSGVGALLGGFSGRESLQLGAGMISRGEVGLIVASVGIQEGLVLQEEFSAIVGMIILTTLITPPLLRFLFAGQRHSTISGESASHAQDHLETEPH